MNGWFQQAARFLIRVVKDSRDDHLLHWAAAMAFYATLSFAPLLLVVMIVTSFFTDVGWAVERLSSVLENFLPDQNEQQLHDFVSNTVQSRNRIGLVSTIAFLYTGTRVFASLTRALNVIYDRESEGSLLRELAVQFAMLPTIGGAFLLALSSRYLFRLLLNLMDVLPAGEEQAAQRFSAGLVQILLLFVAFLLVYRFIPSQEDAWRPPLIGAAAATLLFVVVRPLFLFYLDRFGTQDVVYGSLASLAVLLVWVWIGAVITLVGGEIANATRKDRSGV